LVFALIGGDERMVRLSRLLRADGHTAAPFLLERALGPAPKGSSPGKADCVVFGLPCSKGGAVFAPFSVEKRGFETILDELRPGTPVLAGKAEALAPLCRERGLELHDYFLREDFTVRNAALTAEGALSVMLGKSGRALLGARVLITGFGRIGRLLALRLRALGAEVTAAARSASDRAWAEALGLRALPLGKAEAEGFDFIVSTVPSPVLGESFIARAEGAELIELASPPYGFDLDAAARLGREVTIASGLPGLTAPESAAGALRDTIYDILEV
jgi:dipicolinate synthase subunit A